MNNIDTELLRLNIETNIESEVNIDELIESAEIYNEEFIKVKNKTLVMLFNKDYELVECYGNAVVPQELDDECEVSN